MLIVNCFFVLKFLFIFFYKARELFGLDIYYNWNLNAFSIYLNLNDSVLNFLKPEF